MTALELSNGTLKLHRDRYDDPTESTLVNALYALEDIDTTAIGESFCINNFCEGCTLWNCHDDLCYLLNLSALEALPEGRAMILHPRRPDDTDREIIAREYGEEVTA